MKNWNNRTVRTTVLAAAAVAIIYGVGRGVTPRPAAMSRYADLRVADLDGRVFSMHEQRGKVVLVNFWATWCPPCVRETPALARMYRDFAARGFTAVGISMDDGEAEVREFVRRYQVPYPVARSGDSGPGSNLESLPVTLLIDKQGHTAKSYFGLIDEETVRADIERLLAG